MSDLRLGPPMSRNSRATDSQGNVAEVWQAPAGLWRYATCRRDGSGWHTDNATSERMAKELALADLFKMRRFSAEKVRFYKLT